MTRKLFSAAAVAALLSVGCFSVTRQSGPTALGQSLSGNWTSLSSGSIQDNCTNFTWAVTQYNGSSASGTFGALCYGILQVNGTASATLTSATQATWTVAANASGPGVPSVCAISISGTATVTTTNIVIPYSGTSCLGPLSGTETLKR